MKIRLSKRFCYFTSALLLASWLTPAFAQKPATPTVAPAYVLQPGDEVAVSVMPVTGFDAAGAIAPDGVLYLKTIGDIRAAGLTIPQLGELVQKTLEKKLRRPRVSISLTKLAPPLPPNKITVVGSVLTPGPRDLEPGLRAAKAIELAGGAAKDADLSKVVIIHKDLSRKEIDLGSPAKIGDEMQNVLLQEGDSVYVSAIPPKVVVNFTVAGAVTKPGPLQSDETPRVLKAIELAGGSLANADLTKVSVIRKNLKVEIVDLSTEDKKTDPALNVLLTDGDSVNVPSRNMTVSIDGAVVSPGTYELKPDWGVDDLILAAGKMTLLADTQRVELRRKGEMARILNLNERFKEGQPKVVLEPGDQLVVPEHVNRVLVGGVAGGGYRTLVPGQTVSQFFRNPDNALLLDSAKVDLGKTQLIRGDMPAVPIDLKKILRNPKDKRNVQLASGDWILLQGREPASTNPIAAYGGILGVLARFIAF